MPRAPRLEDWSMTDADGNIRINRAPVLTLWAAVMAERLGFDRATALTLGQAVAGLSAYAKGVSLSILEPRPELVREQSDRLTEGEYLQANLMATSRGSFPVSRPCRLMAP